MDLQPGLETDPGVVLGGHLLKRLKQKIIHAQNFLSKYSKLHGAAAAVKHVKGKLRFPRISSEDRGVVLPYFSPTKWEMELA